MFIYYKLIGPIAELLNYYFMSSCIMYNLCGFIYLIHFVSFLWVIYPLLFLLLYDPIINVLQNFSTFILRGPHIYRPVKLEHTYIMKQRLSFCYSRTRKFGPDPGSGEFRIKRLYRTFFGERHRIVSMGRIPYSIDWLLCGCLALKLCRIYCLKKK